MFLSQDVEIIHLQEKKFVGIPVTSAFIGIGHDPNKIEKVKNEFVSRKEEIKEITNPLEYVCLSFVSESLFTYLICLEVKELIDVPEGMLGFSIPSHKYGKTRSENDPYSVIHNYFNQNGIKNNNRAMSLEIYKFEDPQWPNNVDVYIPIEE
ncbi:AraC family transcriptional regulator [Cohnella endophytica]|uniref:AraC family transcriptional regulator n=1 Tax=Cohnella endophytica TaxID=2419778 RepID=A0A494Y5J8_9BACL|nr:GyrI-like domain-containing protein [Cohnella endophytica]RKP57970.1 AraC family transcriptional regulator [Cohnella endophytica]